MGIDGEHARVHRRKRQERPTMLGAASAKRQLIARCEIAQVRLHRPRDDVVIDRIDHPVAQLVLHAEEAVDVGMPQAAMHADGASEV